MPLWLLIILGGGLAYYLVQQGQAQAAANAQASGTTGGGTGTTGTDMPTDGTSSISFSDDFGPPPPVQPLASGSTFSVPAGTKLFSDSKLTQAAGTSSGQSVTITGNGVAGDGSISVSYASGGKTLWFAQPGS